MELFLEQIQGGEERLPNYQNCWLSSFPAREVTSLRTRTVRSCTTCEFSSKTGELWQNAPLVIGSIGEVVSSKRSWSDSKKGAWEMLNWSLNICITQGPEYLLRRSRNCCGLWQNHCQHFKVTFNKMLAKYWKWPIWWCYFNNGFKSWNKFVSLSSQLELHRLNTGRQVRVVAANRLVKQMLFRWGMILISVWHRSCINRCLVAVKKRFAWFACPVQCPLSWFHSGHLPHNATQWHWNH